jgi:hypothetical protein
MEINKIAVWVGTPELAAGLVPVGKQGLSMRLKTYKDAEKFHHWDLLLRNGSVSVDLVSAFFSIVLLSCAICALIVTVESSASTLSQWVH